jgi:hypothetical protein
MIAGVTSAFIVNIQYSDAIPDRVKADAQVELAGECPSSRTPTSKRH